jgi:hypothetical protein
MSNWFFFAYTQNLDFSPWLERMLNYEICTKNTNSNFMSMTYSSFSNKIQCFRFYISYGQMMSIYHHLVSVVRRKHLPLNLVLCNNWTMRWLSSYMSSTVHVQLSMADITRNRKFLNYWYLLPFKSKSNQFKLQPHHNV